MSKVTSSHPDAKYESLEVASAITDTPIVQTNVSKNMAVEVVAPATLMAGYELEVNVDGDNMIVVVPPGGVEAGQTFKPVVMYPLSSTKAAGRSYNVPVGHWRDGLCDCCKHGCCHPLCWLAYCCTPVALAQILYRMKLDWCGNPTDRQNSAVAFRTVVGVYIVSFGVMYAITFCSLSYMVTIMQDPLNEKAQSNLQNMKVLSNMQNLVSVAVTIYFLVLMTRARRFIRSKYAIPTKSCDECEDCCCAYWCTCCAIAQMARHTADYDTHPAHCCTMTGLPSHLPEVV